MERAIPPKYRLWLGIALLHLTFVLLGSAGANLRFPGAVGGILEQYLRISGAGFSYAFFAPGIFNQLTAKFEVVDGRGESRFYPLTMGVNKEVDLRVISVVDQFTIPLVQEKDPAYVRQYQRSLAASLARGFFRRFPDAERVVVHLEDYEPVTWRDYREGGAPKTYPIYKAQFSYQPGNPPL